MRTKAEIINKISFNGECWEWPTKSKFGYGGLMYKNKYYKAHRVSYEVFNGPIANGLWVLHKCDNPKCVSPEHLFLGSRSDNMKDCYKKGRSKNTFESDTETIKLAAQMRAKGFKFTEIAKLLGRNSSWIGLRVRQLITRRNHDQKPT
jgi:hypothetical protein